MGFWEQAHRGKVPFSSYIISRVHIIHMIYDVDAGLDDMAEVVFVRCLHTVLLGGKCYVQPTLKGWELCSPLLHLR